MDKLAADAIVALVAKHGVGDTLNVIAAYCAKRSFEAGTTDKKQLAYARAGSIVSEAADGVGV